MKRIVLFVAAVAALSGAAAPASAFLFVSGGNAESGDLVAVWAKNGFEWIVNLGPVEALGSGTIASFAVPTQFGVDALVGAKFTALAVPNPDAAYTNLGFPPPEPPQPNIALTTLGEPLDIGPLDIGNAQAVLDTPTGGLTWLTLLNSIPAAGSADVIVNDDDEALISATLFASYALNVGFTTDTIANNIPLSTAVTIESPGYEIPLYAVFQTLTQVGEDYVFGSEVTQLGTLVGDDGQSGNAILSLEPVPEPADAALAAVAAGMLGALAATGRGRARSLAIR